jgi:peptidoglycan/xylan/chitin deacetylase (PgdA/CDA1 family)
MISITVDEKIYLESVWLFNVLFDEILELDVKHVVIKSDSSHNYLICLQNTISIVMDASLMIQLCTNQKATRSVLKKYFSSEHQHIDKIRSLLNDPESFIESINFNNTFQIDLDLFGLMYCLLSGADELNAVDKDIHDRITSQSSILNTFINCELPTVDIIASIFKKLIIRTWNISENPSQKDSVFVTCDVDKAYEAYASNHRKFIKKLGASVARHRSVGEFYRTWDNYWRTCQGDYSAEPNNTFDWMMDVNEKAGNKMAFYFLVDNSNKTFGAHYSIDEFRIRQLMRRIYDRGHEIGLHAGYSTYKCPDNMKKEADKLRQVMEDECIKQDEIGSRQHYLRWSPSNTARCLEAAGIAYDTTLGYADQVGFRCGTSYEFPMFDIENQRVLNIRQRPLIIMEASVYSPKYMNMNFSDNTLEYMKKIKENSILYGGRFTLLWHNSSFYSEEMKSHYEILVN